MSQDKKKSAKAAEDQAVSNAEKTQTPQPQAEIETVQASPKNQSSKKASENKAAVLKAVSQWASERRLAGWQTAAILRVKGWAEDKQIDEAEFEAARKSFMTRAQGGGHGRRN